MLVPRVVPKALVDAPNIHRMLSDADAVGVVAITSLPSGDVLFIVDQSKGFETGTNAAITTTPAVLTSTSKIGREITVQAAPTNTANVSIGSSVAQYLVLIPGASLSFDYTDVSTIWGVAASGTQVINWVVRG